MLWRGLPSGFYDWKPDIDAMSAIEMIRHVLQADYGWDKIILNEDMSNYSTPWEGRPFVNVEDEIEFAQPYREAFLNTIRSFSEAQLADNVVIHPGNGQKKNLAEYLLRVGYHESVHAGQFLSYLRGIGVARPMIWD
jgi:uncharacterized damage-inducible protein DinB